MSTPIWIARELSELDREWNRRESINTPNSGFSDLGRRRNSLYNLAADLAELTQCHSFDERPLAWMPIEGPEA